ncbi:MAG: hypothetical protein Q8Q62_20700 [Mesorhizobium sp.]|nr:hypothetical protein [Mesorhizobium sp.]
MSHSRPSSTMPRPLLPATIVALGCALLPTLAHAHASDRGFVLLLPTGHYIAGGAFAVAASFVVLFFVSPGVVAGLARLRLPLARLRVDGRVIASLLSFLLLVILVAAGFTGSRDPLSNPLPLVVWTLFWIGLTIITGLFGNAFAWINPWYGPYRLLRHQAEPTAALRPWRFGYLPAILQFAGFAWFELVYPAPDDPWRLALVVALYWAVNFAAMLAFGYRAWSRYGECFSVFFRMVSRLAIFERTSDGRLRLCLPGGKLHAAAPLPTSGVMFLLLALGSVSFDGFMRTFAWLGFVGVNPLEFPGRSAVMLPNTLGLAAMVAALSAAYFLAVWAGRRLSGDGDWRRAASLLVWSIVPIALAYHLSHYLVALLVNGQYALAALSDPFSLGWNLFGTADNYISAGLVMGAEAAWVLWNLQAAAIVGGHVLAVVIAHGLASRLRDGGAMLGQLPLTVLMVAYTVFGLWLLSTPTGA